MGEVYKAHDSRLRRDVAIKVSAARFNERFEREARAVAALNHPNICQVYDVGPDYLVMELIEGPTLADRIKEGPLPVDEALAIAAQIGFALEAAHEKQITHRDLKPGNVKIRPDGVVKVLDFGLAKLGGAQPVTISEDSPTLSMAATQAGMILGTAAYMAPEQAKGKQVDKRADIWAFGVVLYEMVTGKRPFQGDEMVEVLAAVVHGQPDLTAVPAPVRRLIGKCLEKDPNKRLRDMSGMEFLLLEEAAPAPVIAAPLSQASKLPWIAAAALAVVAGVTAWALWPQPKPLLPLTRLEVDLGENVSLAASYGPDTVISPDGSKLVYISAGKMYLLRLDQPQATPLELAGTTGAISPAFSPDSEWIVFGQNGARKIPATGGSPQILNSLTNSRGLDWSADGNIVMGTGQTPLMLFPEAGGEPQPLTKLHAGENFHRWPQFLNGGKAVLFTVSVGGTNGAATIEAVSVKDGARKTLVRGGTFGRYVEASDGTGYLTYVNGATLFAVPFDSAKLEVHGTPAPMLDGIGSADGTGGVRLSFSRTGTLVYRGGIVSGSRVVRFMNSAGATETILDRRDTYSYPRLSPDGQKLLIVATEGGATDLWVYDVKGGRSTRLTIGVGTTFIPLWTPDGRYIVYQGVGGMYWTRSDGGSQPQQLTQSKNIQYPYSFTPDGTRLAFMEVAPTTSYDIWTVPLETSIAGLKAGTPEKLLDTAAEERHPAISLDGHWMAYTSNETGKYEVYVRRYPDTGGKWTVSSGGGHYPLWSKNGHDLFYRTEEAQVMVARYTIQGDSFIADPPRKFADKKLALITANGSYDLAPDGRIVGLFPTEDEGSNRAQSHVTFLINFADEIRRRVGNGK
jgi:serine/threonine-protein kinase